MEKRYRPNVAVIVTDGAGRVLLCVRAAEPAGTLQTVQGGIEPGEAPEAAAKRELKEELGLADGEFEVITALPGTYRYDWPKEYVTRLEHPEYVGQEQRFFLVKVKPATRFVLDAHDREFLEVRWGTADELISGAWPPKRPGLQAALEAFGLLTSGHPRT